MGKDIEPAEHPPKIEFDMLLDLHREGRLEELADRAEALAMRYPRSQRLLHMLGVTHLASKRFADAEQTFRKLLQLAPQQIDAQANLAVALKGQGRLEEAAGIYRRLVSREPGHALIHANLGNLLREQGHDGEAIEAYRRATALKPDMADALLNMAALLTRRDRLDEAAEAYRAVLAIRPDHAFTYANLGNLLCRLDRSAEAIEAYRRAIALKPDLPEFHMNLGVTLKDAGQNEAAIEAYRNAILHKPDHADALYNLGNALCEQGEMELAKEAYRKAIGAKPDHASALHNLGLILMGGNKLDLVLATEAFQRAAAANPDSADIFRNLARALQQQGDLAAAIEAHGRALALPSGDEADLARLLHQRAHICEWAAFAEFRTVADRLGMEDIAIPPFTVLAFEDEPAHQRRRSELWTSQFCEPRTATVAAMARPADGRIRIGYFSADFHNHATMYLMAGLFREHDRARFDIHAYSYGGDQDDAMRRHLIANSSSFTNVRGLSDQAVVDLARGDGLDIAVDLKGYTGDTRTQIFALRPAPVQISYIGYPGTLGADFIDYMVADPVVVPDAERAHYSENILYLPHCYQPNDDQRVIAARTATRVSAGLPEHGFVFCSFNNNYKISPDAFDIWMRLLSRVEGSVLWLFEANRWSIANLRREAEARGIDPARLVTAGRLPHEGHLARLHLADLFLDSFAYTAHTTASDALWGGLPIVTLAGRQFAARVGASLLNAVGLPELVTDSPAAYEALALDLATHPERLAAIRDKLAANRTTQPLFDTIAYTRHLEAGYEAAVARHRAGLPPEDIRITSIR